MDRHEGVSCDSCLISNFKGRRYKCLVCFDFDLCSGCYDGGTSNARHRADHPMQCIITPSHYGLFYAGEAWSNIEIPQSYTCPYCCQLGFSDAMLLDHVALEHSDTLVEVICPLCAASRRGDPNLITNDLSSHLTSEHNLGDFQSMLDSEFAAMRHFSRRSVFHPSGALTSASSRTSTSVRPRRPNMPVNRSGSPPIGREFTDPIVELLTQLSEVRRTTRNTNGNNSLTAAAVENATASQLHQLQMHLQVQNQQIIDRYSSHRPLEDTICRQTSSGSTIIGSLSADALNSFGEDEAADGSPLYISLGTPIYIKHPFGTNLSASPSNCSIGTVVADPIDMFSVVGNGGHSASMAALITSTPSNLNIAASHFSAPASIHNSSTLLDMSSSLLLPLLAEVTSQLNLQDYQTLQERSYFGQELFIASIRIAIPQTIAMSKPSNVTTESGMPDYDATNLDQRDCLVEVPEEAQAQDIISNQFAEGYCKSNGDAGNAPAASQNVNVLRGNEHTPCTTNDDQCDATDRSVPEHRTSCPTHNRQLN